MTNETTGQQNDTDLFATTELRRPSELKQGDRVFMELPTIVEVEDVKTCDDGTYIIRYKNAEVHGKREGAMPSGRWVSYFTLPD